MPIALDQFMKLISELIGRIALSDSSHIYRGEPEDYPEVSSNLWRKYKGCHYHDDFDIESLQKERVNAAKEHIPTLANNRVTIPLSSIKADHESRVTVAQSAVVTWRMIEEQRDHEMLTDMQHYGGETNLIDFTRDYLIALFFACDGYFDEDGRIITLDTKRDKVKQCLKEPSNPQNRIIAQKSVFIEPPKGFIEKNLSPQIRKIPKADKAYILEGLRIFHNISAETIYNDLHGFITRQKNHQELLGVHDVFHRGFSHHLKADKKKKRKKKKKHYDRALELYEAILEDSPKKEDKDKDYHYKQTLYKTYNKIAFIYLHHDKLDEAEQCFWKVYDFEHARHNKNSYYERLNNLPDNEKPPPKVIAESACGLGLTACSKGFVDTAIDYYSAAIKICSYYQDAYINRSEAHFKKGDQENALKDWLKVQSLIHHPLVQSLRYYPDFEKQYGVKLPGRRKIRAFTIFGRRIWVKTWREMVEKACTWFIHYVGQVQPDIKERLLNYSRFSEQPENFRAGQHIHAWGINLYVETHGDSRALQKFMTRLITEFEYHEDSLTFEIFID